MVDCIRVSVLGLGNIAIADKYAALLSEEVRTTGCRVYNFFGGAYQFREAARSTLVGMGAEFEEGNDLRLYLPRENLQNFVQWYQSRRERETNPIRELEEELVGETGILPSLQGVVLLRRPSFFEVKDTDNPWAKIRETAFFIDFYDIILTPDNEERIVSSRYARLGLLTLEELRSGRARNGEMISPLMKKLL